MLLSLLNVVDNSYFYYLMGLSYEIFLDWKVRTLRK